MDWLTDYAALKWLHIVGATLLFGTGVGSAFYKFMTDRSGELVAIAVTNRLVVLADWLFTLPTVVLQPITGILLARSVGYPLASGWILASLVLYAVAGACWLVVLYLQIRMRDLASAALVAHTPLDARYAPLMRAWVGLGAVAFAALLAVYLLMIFKPPLA